MTSRRLILKGAGGLALSAAWPSSLAFSASAASDARLVFVLLRGGLDGLHAMPPYADPRYRNARPSIAVPPPGSEGGAIDINGYFGFHPKLEILARLYREGRLAAIPAATTPYRERSHFDGQNVLENGTARPGGARDGWLNRALAMLGSGEGERPGLSIGHAVPLVMQGDVSVRSWAPTRLPMAEEDMLDRLARAYRDDPMLRAALDAARRSPMPGMDGKAGRGRKRFASLAETAGKMIAAPDGPTIAYLEAGGWDTHVSQKGRLDRRFAQFGAGLEALTGALEPVWDKTVILIASEFGRTVAENGSGGTDHGVGGLALALGGAVRGGRILGDWPGLKAGALYQERDLAPANDYRAVFKSVLRDHLRVDEAKLEDSVFPRSKSIRPIDRLIA